MKLRLLTGDRVVMNLWALLWRRFTLTNSEYSAIIVLVVANLRDDFKCSFVNLDRR